MSRLFDIILALCLFALVLPVLLLCAIIIKLSSKGPILYKADRIGKSGHSYIMFKLRTMHIHKGGAAITAGDDRRVYSFGKIMRMLKLDELPQLINIIKGDMAFVGPRPEDTNIVKNHYTKWMNHSLDWTPGLTSPGALYYYAQLEQEIDNDDPERDYLQRVLPIKLALDILYMQRRTVLGDIIVMFQTGWLVFVKLLGRESQYFPQDIDAAHKMLKDQV